MFQEFLGYQQQDDSVGAGRLSGMMSQGRVHRRFVTARLQALSGQGHEPTTEELANAVSLEHLADMVAARVQAEAAHNEDAGEEVDEEEADPGANPDHDPPLQKQRTRTCLHRRSLELWSSRTTPSMSPVSSLG